MLWLTIMVTSREEDNRDQVSHIGDMMDGGVDVLEQAIINIENDYVPSDDELDEKSIYLLIRRHVRTIDSESNSVKRLRFQHSRAI